MGTTEQKDGGSAYPIEGHFVDASGAMTGNYVSWPGMTLRDFLAGQALAGYNANILTFNEPATLRAHMAYEDADAMLSAREGAEPK